VEFTMAHSTPKKEKGEEESISTTNLALQQLGAKYGVDLTKLELREDNIVEFLNLCATLRCQKEEDLDIWFPSHKTAKKGKDKEAIIRHGIRTRFLNYAYCWHESMGDVTEERKAKADQWAQIVSQPVKCSNCPRQINVRHSSQARTEWGKWDFDHKKDKEAVKQLAAELIADGQSVDKHKYFELLWGSNLQLVCPTCHNKERNKEVLSKADLL